MGKSYRRDAANDRWRKKANDRKQQNNRSYYEKEQNQKLNDDFHSFKWDADCDGLEGFQ